MRRISRCKLIRSRWYRGIDSFGAERRSQQQQISGDTRKSGRQGGGRRADIFEVEC
jgi:hypothetical protein